MSQAKKLYKVESEAKLAGVCQGIAEYTGWDVGIIRVITALLIVLGSGTPLVVYIVMAIVLPDKKEVMKELDKEELYPKNDKKNDTKDNNDEYGYDEDDYKL